MRLWTSKPSAFSTCKILQYLQYVCCSRCRCVCGIWQSIDPTRQRFGQSTEQPTYSTRRVHTRSNTLVSFFKLSAHQQQHSSTTICPRQAALQLRAECWGNRDFELLQRTSKRSKPTTKGDTSEEAPERQSLKKGLDFSSPETQEHDAPSTPPPPPFVRVSDLVDMSDDTSYTPAEHKADLETPERVKREPVSLRCCLSSA